MKNNSVSNLILNCDFDVMLPASCMTHLINRIHGEVFALWLQHVHSEGFATDVVQLHAAAMDLTDHIESELQSLRLNR